MNTGRVDSHHTEQTLIIIILIKMMTIIILIVKIQRTIHCCYPEDLRANHERGLDSGQGQLFFHSNYTERAGGMKRRETSLKVGNLPDSVIEGGGKEEENSSVFESLCLLKSLPSRATNLKDRQDGQGGWEGPDGLTGSKVQESGVYKIGRASCRERV